MSDTYQHMDVVTFRLPGRLLEELKAMSERADIPQSRLIRRGIRMVLDEMTDQYNKHDKREMTL